jgi:hypothetical protein
MRRDMGLADKLTDRPMDMGTAQDALYSIKNRCILALRLSDTNPEDMMLFNTLVEDVIEEALDLWAYVEVIK